MNGKWTIENIIIKDYYNGVLINTDTEPGDGSTVDFQNNGSLVVTHPSGTETLTYTFKPDFKVEIDGDIYEIRNLTSSNVTLFSMEVLAPNEYEEVFLNLKR